MAFCSLDESKNAQQGDDQYYKRDDAVLLKTVIKILKVGMNENGTHLLIVQKDCPEYQDLSFFKIVACRSRLGRQGDFAFVLPIIRREYFIFLGIQSGGNNAGIDI